MPPTPLVRGRARWAGNIAENAGGIHCIKYGVTVDHILALEVVTPEGDIVWLGGAHGHYQGVNWVGLFVGSEGTFWDCHQSHCEADTAPNSC